MYNTSFIIDDAGNIAGREHEGSSFDIDVPGEITFRSQRASLAGDGATL